MNVLSASTEKEIIKLLKSSDSKQFNKGFSMLDNYKNTLLNSCKKSYPKFNTEDFNEVFDDALLTLHKKIQQGKFEYLDDGALSAFLSRLIRNQCKNHLRKLVRIERLMTLTPTPSKDIPDNSPSQLFEGENIEIVAKIIEREIGLICQQVVMLRYYEGKKQKEIAEELNLALGTIKNKSTGCMDKLKEKIKQNPKLEKYIRGLLTNES